MQTVVRCEVLVVGGGGAGARAALEAQKSGAGVAIAVKGKFGVSGTRGSGATGYRGNARALHLFSGPKEVLTSKTETALYRKVPVEDEADSYFTRAVQAGLGMADKRLVRVLVDEVLESKKVLEKWGVIMESAPHIDCLIAPMPGLAYVIKNTIGIDVFEEVMITGLVVRDGACFGAVGVDEKSGETIFFQAQSTILATGGNARLCMMNLHPSCVTGDGNAMGYEAGAELINMEFSQVFIATAYPTFNVVPYSVWKFSPRLLNSEGEEFIHRYLPPGVSPEDCMLEKLNHGPFSSRGSGKYLDVAMVKETIAGRANEHDAFYLEAASLRSTPEGEVGRWQNAWQKQWLRFRGIDLARDYIEINSVYHCSNGGLRIDENARTTIGGLYAVGETTGGAYGADRLGGAMMTSSQVFGARAGKHAASTAKTGASLPDRDDPAVKGQLTIIEDLKKRNGSEKPSELLRRLQKSAWENVMVLRTDTGLRAFLKEAEAIREAMGNRLSVKTTEDLVTAVELDHLVTIGEIIANAALMRTESRGGHYRDDFPARDDANWLHSIAVRKAGEAMWLDAVRLDEEWADSPEGFEGLWWG